MSDAVNHPKHYNAHPSGIECIDVVEHMGFNVGNSIKYLWRADEKGNALEDLRKAAWYIAREIEKRERGRGIPCCGGCGQPLDPGPHEPLTPAFVVENARCSGCVPPPPRMPSPASDPVIRQREAFDPAAPLVCKCGHEAHQHSQAREDDYRCQIITCAGCNGWAPTTEGNRA